MDFDVIFIGAGPYGLSGTAYLKDQGMGVGTFGDSMSFWRDHMPAGMYLRSNWEASHISDPRRRFTLDHFRADTGASFEAPVPLERFVEYGQWYQKKLVPDAVPCQVKEIERNGSGFKATLGDGQVVKSKRVVAATGIAPFPWMPKEFEGKPKSHVTHTSDHSDLRGFSGRQVIVIGGGQSALDAARILYMHGAAVEVLAKQPQIRWVGEHAWLHHLGPISWCLYSKLDVGPAGLSRLVSFPNVFRRLPRGWQDPLSYRSIRPAGTGWQRPSLAKVTMTTDCRVTTAEVRGDRVWLKLSDDTERLTDHVIVGTGYRVDVRRCSYLSPALQDSLKTAKGSPVLGRGFESSVPGLHFVGKPAAWSFGPILNFISGSHFAGAELVRSIRR
jgi:lysine/ornithine N-monooxygenase